MTEPDPVVTEAYLRALKDGGDTDLWAARTLHAAGIHAIELDGQQIPVRPTVLEVTLAGKRDSRHD